MSDARGCDTTIAFTINAPVPIDPRAVKTPIACGGQCTGAIDLDPIGGTGPYTYSWNPAPPLGQGTAHISQLCAGTWTVVVTDAVGCSVTETYTLGEPVPLAVGVSATASHCGVCTGAAQLHVAGGHAPYTFTWGAPLNLTTGDSLLVGLCAGLYAVTVTDASGCAVAMAVAIADDDGEILTMTNGMTSCPNTCDGSVSVAYNCSAVPCTVAWTDLQGNVLGQNTDTLTGLCAGTYVALVTNGNGCVSVDTTAVVAPPPLVANISSTPASCAGDCNGTATIGVVGGVGPFSWTWAPVPGGGQGTPHATGLCAGSYSILVHDQGGCDGTYNVLVTSPLPLVVVPTITDVTCAGQCDASIHLNLQGGTGPFTYTWSPMPFAGQGTPQVSGLCAGAYSVLVTDVNGCDTLLNFSLTAPQSLVLSGTTTMSHCGVCDGTASVATTGGTGPYSVQWMHGGSPVGSGPALVGLCAGIYTAMVTDGHGCAATVTLVVPDANGEVIAAVNGHTLCANACDGAVYVTYACGTAPCTVTWFDAAGSQLLQGQDTLSGLCAGQYLVQVVNGAGCTSLDTALVIPSHVILPNLSTTPLSCANRCDGTATVGPFGGVAPYTFTWTPAPPGGQHTPHATGLCAGTYQVAIADAAGCDTLVNVLITGPQPITVSAQMAQVSCNGACDASIVLAPSGGNGFFTYTWSPVPPNGQGNNGAFNLCPGTWSVSVADVNGCDTMLSFTITEPSALVATTSSTLSSCSLCNGTATVNPSGGTAPYAVTWLLNGGIVGSVDTLTGLCAGLYTVHVVDARGCAVDLPVAVNDAGGETLTTTDYTLTCSGLCDGVVGVAFNCSVPTCTVSWFDALGSNLNEPGNTLANLCAGYYYVQVVNGAGCSALAVAQVLAPVPIVANLSTTPVTCAGDCDGTATVGPTGGAGGYQYDWVLGTGTAQGTPHVTNLCPGSYQVTITDQAGCSIIQPVLITAPQPITATAVVVPVTCHSACDGSITLMGQGGTGTLSYQWSPDPGTGQGTNTASGLCAGAWTVTIHDANGCDTTFTLTLTDPPVLNVELVHTDNLCFNNCVATAQANITGGVAPYAISWNGPGGQLAQDTLDVSSLCGGSYSIMVTDTRGCSVTVPFTVATGAPLVANLSFLGESCNGPCDGSATVAPTGGTGSGYAYNWLPGNPAGQGTDHVTGLCPGNWMVTITDGGGCDSTYAFTITPFAPITPVAIVQQVQCNGACNGTITLNTTGGTGILSYLWSPEPGAGQGTSVASGLCPGDYAVTITDAAGCDTTVHYSITEPAALTVVVDAVSAASCNTSADGAISITLTGGMPGYAVAWSGPFGFVSGSEDLIGLLPGAYQVTVTDQNGCQTSLSVAVDAANAVVADAGPDAMMCSGGAVVLNGGASQGASSYQWTDGQGAVVGNGAVVDLGIQPNGVYTFVLTVADGPCSAADSVMVTVLPMPIADAGPEQVVYVQGTVALGGSPTGPPGSSFVWQPDSLLDHSGVSNPNATVHATTWFYLTVTTPDGCIGMDSVLVTVVPEVKVPSGFTPNGDGHNDTWILDFAALFPQIDVQVFSRWGEPLFRSIGYAVPWDGKYSGKPVPMGTYYYVIELHDTRFPEALTGPLTVIR